MSEQTRLGDAMQRLPPQALRHGALKHRHLSPVRPTLASQSLIVEEAIMGVKGMLRAAFRTIPMRTRNLLSG